MKLNSKVIAFFETGQVYPGSIGTIVHMSQDVATVKWDHSGLREEVDITDLELAGSNFERQAADIRNEYDLSKQMKANGKTEEIVEPISPKSQLTETQKAQHDKILAPYNFEIEETYREEGQRAGDLLVASILRQEGFESTSPKEQESARQAIENERAGGNSAEAEMNELAAAEAEDKERAIQKDIAAMKEEPNA